MSGLLLKLQALQYPALSSLTSDPSLLSAASASLSHASVRTLVAWLEASKIRLWPVAERAGLQDVTNDARWTESFQQYLKALNCTRAYGPQMSSEQVLVVLDWLAAQAIAAEYADHAQEYNALGRMWVINEAQPAAAGGAAGVVATAAASSSSSAGGAGAAVSPAPLDCSGEAFENEVRALAQLFKLPYEQRDQQAALVRVVRKRVEECTIAEAAAAQQAAPSATTAAASVAAAAAAAPAVAASSGGAKGAKRGGAAA
jgi:hypothetical protein